MIEKTFLCILIPGSRDEFSMAAVLNG